MLRRFSLLLLLFLLNKTIAVFGIDRYSRADFPPPPTYVFGSGTSAYQVEGAADQDGRTPSIWDTYAHAGYAQGANGDVACDGYHKYKEDVQLMVETGLEAFRFSISWSRLIPNGRGPVNQKGLQFYNNFINELIAYGIQPHVTLHHNDLPQSLEDEYGGWESNRKYYIRKDFTAYADVCFREFGDRVSYWSTVNEANAFVMYGYDQGLLPPMRCSSPFGLRNCSKGNSSTEPYIAAHHILLAHASAAKLYKDKYRNKQQGFIGFSVLAYWFVPLTNTTEDAIATQRANDYMIGWILHPLVFGQYPEIVMKNAGSRIPVFTNSESKQVKGSYDFLGVNFYTIGYVKDNPSSLKMEHRDVYADMAVQINYPVLQVNKLTYEFLVTPWALQRVLEYIKQVYGNPPVYIYENGQPTPRNSSLEDWARVKTMHGYIGSVLDAVRNGSDTRGYFTWSFLDVFELVDGYVSGYGLYYVDLEDPSLKREAKLSAHWYSLFFKGKNMSSDGLIAQLENTLSNHSHISDQ